MKRVVTAAILLLLVVGACFGSYHFISHASGAVDAVLDTAVQQLESGDLLSAQADIEQGYTLWQQYRGRLSVLMRHNELTDAERLFQRTRQALSNRDAAEALIQLRELRAVLALLPEMERPVYYNLI